MDNTIQKSQNDPHRVEITSSLLSHYRLLAILLICVFFAIILLLMIYFLIFRNTPEKSKTTVFPSTTITQPAKSQLTPTGKPILLQSLQKKNKLKSTEIYAVHEFKTSPDNKKVLMLALSGITPFALYYSDMNLENINWVGIAFDALWSPTGRYIAYSYGMTDAGPTRVAVYDTKTEKDIKLFDKAESKDCPLYNYSNISWLEDETGIKATRSKDIRDCPHVQNSPSEAILYFE